MSRQSWTPPVALCAADPGRECIVPATVRPEWRLPTEDPVMLFPPSPPPPNPHHPFVYLNGEIRHVGDLGDRYEADVWLSQSGTWRWTARASRPPVNPTDEEPPVWTHSPGMGFCATEAQATADAVMWLRAQCVAVHGRCG